MTTIVITDTEVCWDSQLTIDGNVRTISPIDKVRTFGRKIFCFAGEVEHEAQLYDWFVRGAKVTKFPDLSKKAVFECVIISDKGFRQYTRDDRKGVQLSAPITLGSGGHLASGALNLMKLRGEPLNAEDAVKAAAESDVYTHGPFKKLVIADVLNKRKKS